VQVLLVCKQLRLRVALVELLAHMTFALHLPMK
jgi:hypothetical protein